MYDTDTQGALGFMIGTLKFTEKNVMKEVFKDRDKKKIKEKAHKQKQKKYYRKFWHLFDHIDIHNIADTSPRELFRYESWWHLVYRTIHSEGAQLIIAMIDEYPVWSVIPWGPELDDWTYTFAQSKQAELQFTEEFLILLSMGLGPWPKGDGDW